MQLYFFFDKDEYGERTYGSQFIVMSKSLEDAKNSIIKTIDYIESGYNIEEMGLRICQENEIIRTEMS